ncbi:hypothetical protein PG985_016353 [Apiospora marii]|uniref:uncharacterized protein n=1 Tax=Apiospora marii TaxID=335849 RepID=UPI00312E942A
MSDEDSSLRSYTTAAETPFESEALGHAETKARHPDSFPATSYVDFENEVNVFVANGGPGTHGTQPANILSVHGRQFYENFRCPQTDTNETARIEGSPPARALYFLLFHPLVEASLAAVIHARKNSWESGRPDSPIYAC